MTFEQAIKLLSQWRGLAEKYPRLEMARFFDFCLRNLGESKAQIFQDLFVLFETNKIKEGFFVEFGAANGVLLSNSHLLEKQFGWKGILAEPARIYHKKLKQNRHCIIDTRCVWSRSGESLIFNETNIPEFSTIDTYSVGDMHARVRDSGLRYEVETIALKDLLDYHRAPRHIDYLSIDTEGAEFEILSNFDWKSYRFEIITVEHNFTKMRDEIFELLSSKGYRRKFESVSQFDDWYVKEDGKLLSAA